MCRLFVWKVVTGHRRGKQEGWNGKEGETSTQCALLSWSLWKASETQSYWCPLRNCTEWSSAFCSQGMKVGIVIYLILFLMLKIAPWVINFPSLPVCAHMSSVWFFCHNIPQPPRSHDIEVKKYNQDGS